MTARPSQDRPEGTPLCTGITQIAVSERTDEYKTEVTGSYETAIRETGILLRLLATDKNADIADLEAIARRFVKLFVTDRNILLNMATTKQTDGDHLFHHSLNVCLLAINVAASYGFSERQVLEIGMGRPCPRHRHALHLGGAQVQGRALFERGVV
jgi:hypothetical protein